MIEDLSTVKPTGATTLGGGVVYMYDVSLGT